MSHNLSLLPRKYLFAAVIILLIACYHAVGYHQGDEHFQILEFAGYKLGWVEAEQLPWEFHERMRPALQPLIAYCVTSLVALFGQPDPFFVAYLLRLLSAGLYLFVAASLYNRYVTLLPERGRWLALSLLFTWCYLYSGIRFSSESWSGACFVLGLLAYPVVHEEGVLALTRVQAKGGWSSALTAGILFGLSFEFRYQLALAVLGFVVWQLFVSKPNWGHLVVMVSGGLATVGLATVADAWLYGDWVFAPWNYLAQNLIKGKAAGFGSEPFYAYVPFILLRGIPPLSLFYLAAIGWFCYRYRQDPIVWACAVFFVAHSVLARKDVRFLFPFLPFLPLVLVVALRDLRRRYGEDVLAVGWRKFVFRLLIGINVALVIGVSLRPLGSNLSVMRYIHRTYDTPITLLADGRHVYNHSDLVIDWYQPAAGVTILASDTVDVSDCPTGVCLYSRYTRETLPAPAGMELLYTTAPGWLDRFDAWGLLRQPRYWYLYRKMP